MVNPINNATLPLNQSITFSWNPVANAATYQIQIDDSSSFSSPLVLSRTGLTQTQTTHTLTSQRTYWWRVRGRTSGGTNGAWSTVRSFVIAQVNSPTPTRTPTSPLSTATALPSTPIPTATQPASTATNVPLTATLTDPTPTSVPPTATRTSTPVAADTVSIQMAESDSGNRRPRVEATGSNSSATLRVYVTSTNALIGTLTNEGGGRYRGEFSWSTNPQHITVRSSLGGQATLAVTLK